MEKTTYTNIIKRDQLLPKDELKCKNNQVELKEKKVKEKRKEEEKKDNINNNPDDYINAQLECNEVETITLDNIIDSFNWDKQSLIKIKDFMIKNNYIHTINDNPDNKVIYRYTFTQEQENKILSWISNKLIKDFKEKNWYFEKSNGKIEFNENYTPFNLDTTLNNEYLSIINEIWIRHIDIINILNANFPTNDNIVRDWINKIKDIFKYREWREYKADWSTQNAADQIEKYERGWDI